MASEADVKAEWQPIETAPKDGTPVLLFGPDGRIGLGYMTPESMGDSHWLRQSAAWIGADKYSGDKTRVALGGYEPDEATHWMPLPKAPKPAA